jgi:translation initiation factor 2B subunit (eIF-2B alpha/beta/delta family)
MTRLAPILLVLLAFATTSCNGDDAPSDEAPSQAEYAERANEICREAEQSLEDVAEDADEPEDIVDAIDELIEEARDTVAELADLERPEGEAGETAARFVDATRAEIHDQGVPALEELRRAVESEDTAAIREAAVRLRQLDTSVSNRAARTLGATDCARSAGR